MFKSILKPESAVTTGVLEAIGVYLIYHKVAPSMADVHASPSNDSTVEATRKKAAIESAVLLGTVFAITRDLNAFIIGGVAMLAIDYSYKHGNAVNPATGKMDTGNSGQSVSPTLATAYPVASYDEESGYAA